LRQDVVFFDDSRNSSGILTSFVTSDVKVLSGLSGVFLGTVFSAVATVLGGLVLGLVIGWKLTLVSMVTIPIIMVSGYFRLNLVTALEKITRRAYEQSAGHVCEQVNAIQAVAALGLEHRLWQDYTRRLHVDRKVYLRATFRSSLLYAFSDALPFACMALGFWYGGNLVINGEVSNSTACKMP
jgi:ATP-binding cassette subfamily B (MDR/TAP) protein 1